MDALCVEGPVRLTGDVRVSGSKNATLPLLFASLVFEKPLSFENVPRLWDVETTLGLLGHIGAQSEWDKDAGKVRVAPAVERAEAPYDWVKRMRAGVLALGPLVARAGHARVSLPGGCAIGARPIDYHLLVLEAMGAEVVVEQGYVQARAPKGLAGARVRFPQVSVTGTENALVLAALARGETVLENAAREPEVVTVGEFLRQGGVTVEGLGTETIRVQGRAGALLQSPTEPVRMPADRIETGTWIAAAAVTGGDVRIAGTRPEDQEAVLRVFRSMGVRLDVDGDVIHAVAPDVLEPVEVTTEPFPGYATDMQAQLLVACCRANGTSRIRETIFENRFMHVAELRRLGAQVELSGREAIIHGPVSFSAAPIMATDLRASACLVLGALAARGVTKVSRIYHLDRGYSRIERKLADLGARAWRITETVV
jgi:UDP-N-acetylglucosamine 1-carboxyvinyltransferase